MPVKIGWSAKFAPDPKDPRYSIVVGSYAHDFLTWAKLFGKPSWHPRGDQGIAGRQIWLQEPIFETITNPDGTTEAVLVQKGVTVELFWPLPVLERIFNKMQSWDPVGLINPHDGEYNTKGCV